MLNIREQYIKNAVPQMKKSFGWQSSLAVPRITKVVVNVGVGKMRDKKDAVESVVKYLSLITGQKASPRPARVAVASFKSREGMVIGYKVTLRGQRMFDFLDRLV